MFRRTSHRLGYAIVLLVSVFAPLAHAGTSPSATVERLHGALLEIMREADALGFSGRLERVEPAIAEAFDLRYVAGLLVSRYWSDLSAVQRDRMAAVFSAITIATYADRFDGYTGQRFVTVEEKPFRRSRRLVRTQLQTEGEAPVRLDYVLQERDGQWRIVNVIADGVSELALKKSEYSTIIKSEGFDALIARLEAQLREIGDEGVS